MAKADPKCYECKHRQNTTYSHHSECKHPVLADKVKIFAMASVMMRGRFEPFNVVGNKHGISHGWFNWPLDFDPIWLESCDQFESK